MTKTAASTAESNVDLLTEEVRQLIVEQGLAYVATVNADGTPNLSPRGSLMPWRPNELVFLEIRRRRTFENLQRRPAIEVNVVDPMSRMGYRLSGVARTFTEGSLFEEVRAYMLEPRLHHFVSAVMSVRVHSVEPLVSPAYDQGLNEQEIRTHYEARRLRVRRRATKSSGAGTIDARAARQASGSGPTGAA